MSKDAARVVVGLSYSASKDMYRVEATAAQLEVVYRILQISLVMSYYDSVVDTWGGPVYRDLGWLGVNISHGIAGPRIGRPGRLLASMRSNRLPRGVRMSSCV